MGGQRRRYALAEGLNRIGGPGCDVVLPDVAGDELHLWSDPPKILTTGGATTPLLNGRAFEESELASGDTVQWGTAVLVYGREASALVEELVEEAPPAATTATGTTQGAVPERLRAGLLADLKLCKGGVVRRWQDAVLRGEFDPDACARDLLASSDVPPDDPRLLERAARLQRDLVMAPLQRGLAGAGRRARGAARQGTAYLLANLIAISVYTLVLVAILVLVRLNYGFSVDGMIDGILQVFDSGE